MRRLLPALAAGALALLWLALRPGPVDRPAPGEAPPSASPGAPALPPEARREGPARTASAGRPGRGEVGRPAAEEEAPETTPALSPVEAYRRYAVHPPDSRPLDARQSDLIDWNRRHEAPRPDPDDPGVTILFTADRFHVVGDQTLSPVLDVRRGEAPAAVRVAESVVELPDGQRIPFTLAPQGEVHAGVVRPADLELDGPVRLAVRVAFDAGGGPRHARIFAHYTPAAAVPARFGAALGDRVVDGSLEVAVELHVETPGLYLIDANLFADGRPVAWTRSKPRLEAGTHRLPLRFFGKALADAGLDGPYTVEQLRGALAAPGSTPPTVQMPPFAGAITTGAYAAGDFSSAEWDAPEKRDRIARLRRLEARGGPVVTTPAWREDR